MERIMITGALGQIGTELTVKLREIYGDDNVLATDINEPAEGPLKGKPFKILDVRRYDEMVETADEFKPDTIMHMAALLSATCEEKPLIAWDINMGGLVNALETARKRDIKFFTPSSIGAFGPSTPKKDAPQTTIQRPTSMYGVNKVAGELLCDYYFKKFGVDTRGLRFPGLISHVKEPGGGTTDYAVEIYFEAVKSGKYTSYIGEGTYMDMMYMDDAIDAVIQLMEADAEDLTDRNAFNVSAMSVEPGMIAREIEKHIPGFELDYDVDPVRQGIADSWPDSIDTSEAEKQWGFSPRYDLEKMTTEMINAIRDKS
ncbi:NAD-dependent epimerase/dehydratase family protein [Salinicoccus halitifaciens]|uniref:Nucleoside-diphosphate-sugar epimerase n=1 Tax=Salinicoccus halitifaciens TaxID=1073415 RepID=A0ABV2EBH7_9STAP|nr:NAD-dependent epimerase/dehydratase family protein [Salinicoccus halitifaciens]MCD2138257.1 NAD-dependent epimerase/dehydratase family protein [Salinicoccus halitifaciens]